MGESKVRVFVVRIRVPGCKHSRVYRESLSAAGARAMARLLALEGHKVSVVRFDVSARDLDARLGQRRPSLKMPVKRLQLTA